MSDRYFTIGMIIVLVVAVVLLKAAAPDDSVFWISAKWAAGALASAMIVLAFWRPTGNASTADVAQGAAALATIVAFVVAARIYFLESEDMVRLSVGLQANAVPMSIGPEVRTSVLLVVRVPIENRGSIPAHIHCTSIDVQHPAIGTRNRLNQNWERNADALEEVELSSIGTAIQHEAERGQDCLQGESRYFDRPIRPLFMWNSLTLQPGDQRDRYFEIPVACGVPFVRVIVKVRVTPGNEDNHEVKTIVPLIRICSGQEESSAGVSTPMSGGDPTSEASPAPNAGTDAPANQSGNIQ